MPLATIVVTYSLLEFSIIRLYYNVILILSIIDLVIGTLVSFIISFFIVVLSERECYNISTIGILSILESLEPLLLSYLVDIVNLLF